MQLLFRPEAVKAGAVKDGAGKDMSLGDVVRRADPDRYFCALFAPETRREALFALYAFNHELARACEVTREPGLAMIRLQWWREVVEGDAKAHDVAAPLRAAVADGTLDSAGLLAMIDAREREAEGDFARVEDWVAWARAGAGSLMVVAAQALGAPADELPRVRDLGGAYGVAGQLRNVPAFAARGRCLLPEDACARFGLTPDAVARAPDAPAVAELLAWLAVSGKNLLGDGMACERGWMAALLPAVLARRDLAGKGGGRRLAVLVAGLRGRQAVLF